MLNKEEIEEGKAHLSWLLDNGILTSEDEPYIETVLKYIKQLESDKQKLIEKLEERRKQNNNKYGQSIDDDEFLEMYKYSGQV